MNQEGSFLRLYIDSANPDDWDTYLATGMFYGVTTNPILIAKAGLQFQIDPLKDLAKTAFDLGAHEISHPGVGEQTGGNVTDWPGTGCHRSAGDGESAD